jgi:type 1 fimbriae regulatory protein FimB/type 1 fimbriae regulatory protein FimE
MDYLVALKLEQYEFKSGCLTVSRVKNGRTSIHTVEPKERKAIKELVGDRRTGYVLFIERGTPLTPSGIMKILARAGREAIGNTGELVLNFPVHPHILRHACGCIMNDSGFPIRHIQEWLGHKNIRHTERYAAMSPSAFKGISFDKG